VCRSDSTHDFFDLQNDDALGHMSFMLTIAPSSIDVEGGGVFLRVLVCGVVLVVVGCKIPCKENSLISRGIGDFSIYPARACLFSGKPG